MNAKLKLVADTLLTNEIAASLSIPRLSRTRLAYPIGKVCELLIGQAPKRIWRLAGVKLLRIGSA